MITLLRPPAAGRRDRVRPSWTAEARDEAARERRRPSQGPLLLGAAIAIVVLFHGSLLLAGSYQRTYDAWVHIFMGDHYRRWWFSSWDPRWYTGFTTVSYPPGTHQSIALLSRLVGLRTGFVLVQLFALVNLTVGVYRWAKLWVDERAAGWAAILLAVSSAIAETVHVFGQLPTTFSLGFLLNSLPFAFAWVRDGNRRALLAGVATTAATTAGHHVTTLFGSVFFVGPVLVAALVDRLRAPRAGETVSHPTVVDRHNLWPLVARRIRRVLPAVLRASLYGTMLVAALVIVVLPYWLWSHADPITQVAIPHASRDNFLVNLNAGLVFWLIPWGFMVLVLPYALLRGLASRAWPLTLSLAGLAFLGTGGTTPLPRMLLGGAFYVLTLDRFTFWATIAVLPLAGHFVESLVDGTIGRWLAARLGRVAATAVRLVLAGSMLTFTLYSANLTHYRPFQPATIDVKPIVSFMNKDDHWRWRYLTLGFGDQMAWLSANMTATTVDGNYHSARRLPELTSRPVERLEGSKYSGVPGIGSLQQFLSVPSRYSLKYVFVNDRFYEPLLHFTGWHELGLLENGIAVWERADVPPLPGAPPDHQIPAWQRGLWGVVPMSAISGALVLMTWMVVGAPVPHPLRRWRRRRGRPERSRASMARRAHLRRLYGLLPPVAIARAVDRRLETAAARVAGQPRPQRWQRLVPLVQWVRARRPRVASRRRRALNVALLVALVAGGLVAVLGRASAPPGPAAVVGAYYDHLDFRRFEDAYALLDPRTRPDATQFRMDLTSDGGLVASFSKMASIRTELVDRSPQRAVVRALIVYLTSLATYTVEDTVVLRPLDGRWYVELPPADPTQPPDQFTSRPGVEFLQQGRRVVTSGPTAAPDVLDRPELAFRSVRSMRVGDGWAVVGEVVNVDVDPADVTVNAQLRDADGALLAGYDAAQVMVHKLLPGEGTPFRIDFESVAGTVPLDDPTAGGADDPAGTPLPSDALPVGTTAPPTTTTTTTPSAGAATARATVAVAASAVGPVEFDPAARYPLALPPHSLATSVDVYARAVVTTQETDRGLQVVDAHLERTAEGATELVGELRNDTTIEAAVPQLLVSYVDGSGAVLWVDGSYLEHSLRPQRSQPFRLRLREGPPGMSSGVTTTGYADGAEAPAAQVEASAPMVTLSGWPSSVSAPIDGDGQPTGLNVLASGYFRMPET